MARRVNISQLNARIRQAQSKLRQELSKVKRNVNKQNTAHRQAVASRNRKIRAYNNRLRSHQNRLNSELKKLARQTSKHPARQTRTTRYTVLINSVSTLSSAYNRLDDSDADPLLSDLAEKETANSAATLNNLLNDDDNIGGTDGDLKNNLIADELEKISSDLNDRWLGALYALSPMNPDATRHFCTSAREIITGILDIKAPDDDVFSYFPDCEKTKNGNPIRRTKIRYCLDRHGSTSDTLENFIDTNIDDIIALFEQLNSGTHGPAGKFSLQQLLSVKTRVEDAIHFICEI